MKILREIGESVNLLWNFHHREGHGCAIGSPRSYQRCGWRLGPNPQW